MRYGPALKTAGTAALEAGQMLRTEFQRPGGRRGSGSHAEVDVEAERVIRDRLLGFRRWSYIGEETGTAFTRGRHCWVVDPNDGTSSYMAGRRGSAVSIGLLRDGSPILGVVFAFNYPDEQHATLYAWSEGGRLTANGKPVENVPKSNVVLVSDHYRPDPSIVTAVAPATVERLPSIAHRLARAACGDAAAAIALGTVADWDVVGGHALLIGAGMDLYDDQGKAIRYGRQGRAFLGPAYGGRAGICRRIIRRRARERERSWKPVSLSEPKSWLEAEQEELWTTLPF